MYFAFLFMSIEILKSHVSCSFDGAFPFEKKIDSNDFTQQVVAKAIWFFSFWHTIFHFANYSLNSVGTLSFFKKYGWEGTPFFTGFVALYSLFIIFWWLFLFSFFFFCFLLLSLSCLLISFTFLSLSFFPPIWIVDLHICLSVCPFIFWIL